jgi:MFS family permease
MTTMKRNLLLLAACQGLMMTSAALIMTTAALVGYSLAENKAFASLPLSLNFLATMLATAPASLLMGRIGRRSGFLLANVIGVVGAGIAAWAIWQESFAWFSAGALLIGVFKAFGNYYRFAAADVATPDYRSRAISWVLAGGLLAAFAGPALANWTVDLVRTAPFAASYLALIGLYGASLLVLAFIDIPRPAAGARKDSGRPLATIAVQPSFIVAVLGGMLGYGVMILVMTATPLAMDGHGHSFGSTAFVIQWHVFAMFAPSLVTGQLISRYGVLNVMLWGGALTAACVGINLLGHSVAHYWLALFLLGIGWNFLFVGATTLLTQAHRPEETAKTQGLNDLLVFSTVSVAALSAGMLQHHLGWEMVNLGVVPFIAVILVAIVWLKLAGQRAAAAPREGTTAPRNDRGLELEP